MPPQFPGLASVYDKESLRWLIDNHPLVYDELLVALNEQGGTPTSIADFTRRWVGTARDGFERRIEQAARAILAEKK